MIILWELLDVPIWLDKKNDYVVITNGNTATVGIYDDAYTT